jgi:hypothetical protein
MLTWCCCMHDVLSIGHVLSVRYIPQLILCFLFKADRVSVFKLNPPPPQRHLAPPPKRFCTPSNYTYLDLIFSYLVILITKFVKLLILWSQISPCRPRKQVLLNIFLSLSGRCHQAPVKASSSTPPPPDIYPPPGRKYENPSLCWSVPYC